MNIILYQCLKVHTGIYVHFVFNAVNGIFHITVNTEAAVVGFECT